MVIKNPNQTFDGCDFVLQLDKQRKGTKIKLLQLTDMQFIDSTQARTPDRLRPDEIKAWLPENFEAQGGNQIKSLVAQSKPDLIFITGDIIYGSFDDNGSVFEWYCNFMDSLEIPWAPVFGNHDNESKKGVKWQCDRLEKSKYCIFKRGSVSGNGNYTIGIAIENELVRVIHMLDSNGCVSDDPEVIREMGIYPDQIDQVKQNTRKITAAQKKVVPAFMAFHIPTEEFVAAERAKGYAQNSWDYYTIGVEVEQKDDDFGSKREKIHPIKTEFDFTAALKECNVEAVFAGHCHNVNTCITHNGIRWVFGLKTAQYDYHIAGQLGGTLITLENEKFHIIHIPALVKCAPFPKDMRIFSDFFAE
ncbi:MAG: metallophosphoesterase [Clostridia bacterium]|nr:metallophosphoesterase [Clostridia bacterium]